MDVNFATSAAPGRRNEDLVMASENYLVMLDGVTSPPHVATGCIHDPVWLVRTLGHTLAEHLSRPEVPPLTEILADSITAVSDAHRGTCDLSHPESPSSTVVLLRERADDLDYLVLCDSTVVLLDNTGEISHVVTDNRTAAMRGLTRREVAERRNHEGGFWVASTNPAAAGQAITGSAPANPAFACTDGVSRLIDYFGHDWRQVVDLAVGDSVRAVINAVRRAERTTPLTQVKPHDDATAALCRPSGPRHSEQPRPK